MRFRANAATDARAIINRFSDEFFNSTTIGAGYRLAQTTVHGSDAFVGGEAPLDGGYVFLQFLAAADADQGDGDRGVAEHPGDGELGDRLAVAGGDWPQAVDHGGGQM